MEIPSAWGATAVYITVLSSDGKITHASTYLLVGGEYWIIPLT